MEEARVPRGRSNHDGSSGPAKGTLKAEAFRLNASSTGTHYAILTGPPVSFLTRLAAAGCKTRCAAAERLVAEAMALPPSQPGWVSQIVMSVSNIDCCL